MSRPQRVISSILDKKQLSWKCFQIDLKHIEPQEIQFEPGQFISVKVGNPAFRAYSIASDYKISDRMSLIVATGHNGLGANLFKSIEIGDQIEFIGPAGKFGLQEPLSNEVNFFATGTGIAPFIPMLIKLNDMQYKGKVNVYMGFRTQAEVYFSHLVKHFKLSHLDLTQIIYISQPEEGFKSTPLVRSGRITSRITSDLNPEAQYYLCGNPQMIVETKELLNNLGIASTKVISEPFTYI